MDCFCWCIEVEKGVSPVCQYIVLTFAFLFLYFLFLLQYIFTCFKEAGNLCADCYIALKKQKACVPFVITFCLIFYSVCEAAEGLWTVCYFILCTEQQTTCVILIFLPCCFEEVVSSSKICCSNIL